jgi:serine protease Do
MIPKILIKHLAGSQANRIEQFALDGTHELIIGRAPPANVVFDGCRDDTVSRRHARIRIMRGERLRFTVTDLDSTNGVRLNGRPVRGEQDLAPGDVVELSPGGPAFSLSVESEPVGLDRPPQSEGPSGRAVHTLPRPRADRGLRWFQVAALVVVGSGLCVLLYQREWTEQSQPPLAPKKAVAASVVVPPAPPPVKIPPVQIPPESAQTILAKSTAYLEARWRLYDSFTGKPVFQKTWTRHSQQLPCFVELADHRLVPWLTTDDEEHRNIPIGGSSVGSGFIVTATGGVITGKHVAAAWTQAYGAVWTGQVAIFKVQRDPARPAPSAIADLDDPQSAGPRPAAWIPGNGGFLFRAHYPVPLGSAESTLEGRNERLTAQFPQGRAAMPARLLRSAVDADLAELKIDTDRPLPAVALAPEGTVSNGAHVLALGYAARRTDTPALVTVDGTITGLDGQSGLGLAGLPADGSLAGSPVATADGKVVAVVASEPAGGNGTAHAYPVRFVRALLDLE